MNTFTLLVWELIPEETYLYLIPNEVADKYKHYLDQAQNRMVNQDDLNDGMNFLIAACSQNEDDASEEFKKYTGLFGLYRYTTMSVPITNQTINKVYFSGFCL